MVIQVPLLLDQQEVLCGIIIITTAPCGLFNDDVSISEYIAFNYRMINWKGRGVDWRIVLNGF
jgi:hypothetical protein